jgi:hypothetical protein
VPTWYDTRSKAEVRRRCGEPLKILIEIGVVKYS